jgi:hypothetical protein
MDNNIWRMRYNEEIHTLLKGEDLSRWLGHVERMEDNAMP